MLQVTTETRQNVRTQSETDGTSSSRESYGESVIATDNDSKNASTLLNSSVHPSSGNDSIDGMDEENEVVIAHEIQQNDLDKLSEDLSMKPPFIVVLAQWRLGSSIVGQIFNQNRDVFYLFEPLWLVDPMRNSGPAAPGFLFAGCPRLRYLRAAEIRLLQLHSRVCPGHKQVDGAQ